MSKTRRNLGLIAGFVFLLIGLAAGWAIRMSDKPTTLASHPGARQRLTVVTYNLWHGLNPVGLRRFAEYESAAQREARRQGFLRQVRALNPDVLFLQEVNPAPGLSRRLARELGYDAVYAVDNAGLKLGSLGLPVNLRSGLAILAKKNLDLHRVGACKLSGPFGWAGRWSSLQLKEFRYALAATILLNGERVLLMDTHLHHGPEADANIRGALRRLAADGTITGQREAEIIATFNLASQRRLGEITRALTWLEQEGFTATPMLFAGDFNASPASPELTWLKSERGFCSTTADDDPATLLMTWDFQRNPNTHFFDDFVPVNTFEPAVMAALQPAIVTATKRLDYLFHRGFGDWRVARSGLFADSPIDGRFCSDHFGIFTVFELVDGGYRQSSW